MADIDMTTETIRGKARRCSEPEPVPIGALIPGVRAKIEARCQRAVRRLRTQRQNLRPTTRLAG